MNFLKKICTFKGKEMEPTVGGFATEHADIIKRINDSGDEARKQRYIHGLGAIYGALIGDSMGSFVEFQKTVSDHEVELALDMPGGGCWRVQPGQITDDGELTMCLLHGLRKNLNKEFTMGPIMLEYQRWMLSGPFDIGNTTQTALYPLQYTFSRDGEDLFELCQSSSIAHNGRSQSNGCLMRQSPLGVFCSALSEEETTQIALWDTQVTHSNENVFAACQCYTLAIRHLVLNPGDCEGAFKLAKAFVTREQSPIKDWWEWVESDEPIASVQLMGWAKIAFSHAFRALRNPQGLHYKTVMRQILKCGGDTDTNACIAGGLVGAALGVDNIPDEYKEKIYSWNPLDKKAVHPRIPEFSPQFVPEIVLEFVSQEPKRRSPSTTEVKPSEGDQDAGMEGLEDEH